MEIRSNQGYIITSSVHVGEAEFVLGVSEKALGQYVTWKCSDGKDYYWGHYFTDLLAATKDLITRTQEEIEFLEQRSGQIEKQKTTKSRERER